MTDMKVVDEALFRFTEMLRMQAALNQATKDWLEWIGGLSRDELGAYVQQLPRHLSRESQEGSLAAMQRQGQADGLYDATEGGWAGRTEARE